nr:MAG TPA: hypothetical protein [Caudoviricetes sp.]
MNLFYEEYPDSVCIHGKHVRILTDFREYIRLIDMIKDKSILGEDKIGILSMYFLDPIKIDKDSILAMTAFIEKECMNNASYSQDHGKKQKPVFSYEIDYPYILAGFLHDYGIDLQSINYMHWWKFRALFDGLSEDTEIKKRIMYRSIDLSSVKDKDERKRISKIQKQIALPMEQISDYEIGDAFG